MASSKSEASDSAALCEEVQAIDSNEPLVTKSTASSCSAEVFDSSEPLSPTSAVPVQVLDSSEPLVTAPAVPTSACPSAEDLAAAGPSGVAAVQRPISGSSGRRINPYAVELSSMWNWFKIFKTLGTDAQCVEFAENEGLILREKMCSYHRRPMTITHSVGQVGSFRCRKSNCRTRSESRAKGTFFENARLPITLIFRIMYAFSVGLSYHDARKELASPGEEVLSTATVADWYSYCRETIVIYEIENETEKEKIGGPNKIVQIDESKFGKRKYNRGRHIEGHWVIGMIEDGSDDLRLEVCPDNERSAQILVPLIKKHVREGSIIHTDFWRAYMSLPEHGYIHKRVNHSDPINKFVAPDGTHTQRIESQWRGLKQKFRKEQNKSDFSDWLIETSWRRRIRFNHLDPYSELLKAVKYVYKIN